MGTVGRAESLPGRPPQHQVLCSLGLGPPIQKTGVATFQSLTANFPKCDLLTSLPMRYSGRKEFGRQINLGNKTYFAYLLKILSPY